MKKLNIFRIIFIVILATISIISLLKPRNIETNLLRAFLINNEKNETLIELSGKYSANINILFESNTPDQLEKTKEEFLNQIDQSIFEIQSANFEKTLDFYKKYKNNRTNLFLFTVRGRNRPDEKDGTSTSAARQGSRL